MILEEAGHHVLPLTHAHTAHERVRREQPELIILDWVLGETTGDEVLHRLRLDPATKRIPILLVSVLSDLERQALLLGADGFLGKPFEEKDLLQAVERLLPRPAPALEIQPSP